MKKALFITALFAAVISAQENYSTAWSGHKYVIVNSAAAGTAVPVVKLPLLVRLDSTHASIFTQAKAGGADVRFTKADNATRLPHQIESWDAGARTAAIWVLADTIPAFRNNFALRLHWGNASAVDSSNGAKVFDTANAFQAVWHMAGSANESDATLNAFTAAQNGAPPSVPGAVGAGRTVTSGNYFRAVGTASGKLNFPEGGNYSLSAWVFCNSLPSAGTVISKHDNAYALKLNADVTSWEFFEFGTDLTAAGWNWVNAPLEGSLGAWTHLVGVHSASDVALFVNGIRQDGGFSTASSTAARVLTRDVVIGAQPAGSNTAVQRPFDGTVDEVRMASAARDPDWIRLDFETQKPGSAVVKVLDSIPPTSLGSAAARDLLRATFSVRASGHGLLFRLDGLGGAGAGSAANRARLEVLDMRGLTVWSGVSELKGGVLAWEGRTASGRPAPQGVYAVRISLLDGRGQVARTLGKKVPFTR